MIRSDQNLFNVLEWWKYFTKKWWKVKGLIKIFSKTDNRCTVNVKVKTTNSIRGNTDTNWWLRCSLRAIHLHLVWFLQFAKDLEVSYAEEKPKTCCNIPPHTEACPHQLQTIWFGNELIVLLNQALLFLLSWASDPVGYKHTIFGSGVQHLTC